MKQRGLKRLRGCGCNSARIKKCFRRPSNWQEMYDRSGDYGLKVTPRKKIERFYSEED